MCTDARRPMQELAVVVYRSVMPYHIRLPNMGLEPLREPGGVRA